jgi:hypothetical protein
VHHVLVGHVRVREDHLVDLALPHDSLQLGLGHDRDPVGVAVAGELGRVDAAVDVRNLGRREPHHLVLVAAAVDEVEVVEVAPCGADDEHASSGHDPEPSTPSGG